MRRFSYSSPVALFWGFSIRRLSLLLRWREKLHTERVGSYRGTSFTVVRFAQMWLCCPRSPPPPPNKWRTDGLIYLVCIAEPVQMWHRRLQMWNKANTTYSKSIQLDDSVDERSILVSVFITVWKQTRGGGGFVDDEILYFVDRMLVDDITAPEKCLMRHKP